MAILRNDTTVRSADGQTTSAIITAANIGNYGISTTSTYYIGTTQNVFNRASGAQTLTGVSIDGNAANITAYTINQNVGTGNAPSFTGMTSTAMLVASTSMNSVDDWQNSPISIRERGLVAAAQSANTYSPNLNFHWASRISNSLWMDANGNLSWGSYDGTGVPSSDGAFYVNNLYASIYFDKNNTSYYLDAANSGTSLLVAGNVGIGNTSPSAKLHVLGASYTTASAANNNVRFEGGGGNGLGFGTIDATSTYASWIQSGYVPNFATATYALLLNPLGGNVGIGTTSPGYKLDVTGEIRQTGNNFWFSGARMAGDGSGNIDINYNNGSLPSFTWYNGGTSALVRITSAGNVGIGTTSPSQKLHVVGTGFASTDFRAPIFYDSDNTTYYLDPNASTSGNLFGVLKQNDGKFVRDSYFRTISGTGDYYASGASGWYTVASITLTTNCTGGVLYGTLYDNRYDGADTYQIAIVARAECDFTTNNESHYVNVGCTILGSTGITNYQSKIRVLLVASSTNSRTYEVQFFETSWNRDTWQLETGGSPVWTIYSTAQAPGTSTGTARVFYISNKNADNIRANTASYSPIYYDSNDTSYYSDPAGLNRFNALNIGNQGALTGNTTYALGAYHNSRYMVGLRYSSGGAAYPWLVHDSWNGSAFIIHFNGVGDKFNFSESGIGQASGDFRAPIFYDSNDTGYYLNPASTSNINALTVAGGNATIYRDLIVNGGASGSFGNRIIVQGTATTYTLQDTTFRPTVYLNGDYPVVTLNCSATTNTNHGPTLQFAFNGLTTGGSTSRQVVIGANGIGSWLDFGFSGGANGDNTSYNPHNGIAGYNGITPMRLFSNGLLLGSTGAFPNHITSTSFALDVRGTGSSNTDFRAPIFYDSNNTAYYIDAASTSVLNRIDLPSGSAAINTTTPGTSAYQLNFTGQGTADNAQAITWGWSTSGAQAGIYVQSSGGYGTKMYIATTDSFATGSKTALTIDHTGVVTTNRNYLQATGSLRAPIFYDSDNTAYYIDAASTSNLNVLVVAASARVGGAASRSTSGLTVGFTDNSTFAANTDVGDTDRMLSIVNESSTTNAMSVLGFRVNPNGGTANAMMDIKFVQTGATNTSALYYTFNHGGTFADRLTIQSSGNIGVNTSDFSYTSSDNSRLVGSNTSNRLFVNGSIQLLNNNDAIVIGRGTATFLSDEELGFGWGGGWYMTDGTYLRVRNDKVLYTAGEIWGSIFKDSNNTAYYVDPASTGYSAYFAGAIQATKIGIEDGGIDCYMEITDANPVIYGVTYGGEFIFYGDKSTPASFLYYGGATVTYTLQANSSLRAPIFYDSNDTTYYTDPASFSLISSLGIGGLTSSNNVQMYDSYVDASSSYLQSPPLIIRKDSSATGAIDQAPVGLFIYNLNGTNNTWTKLSMGNREAAGAGNTVSIAGLAAQKTAGTANAWATGNLHFWTKAGGTQITNMIAYSSGYVQSDYSFRSPIFYDSNNTSYYLDPASTSNLNVVNLIGITGAGAAYIQTSTTGTSYTSHFQIREANGGGGNTSEIYAPALGFHWSGVVASNILMESSGRIAIRNNPGSGYENFIANAIYGAVFYDSNDVTYYTDPSSLSNILELKTNKNWYDSSASAWGGGINMGGNNPTIGFQSTSSTWWYMLHHASSNINFYRRSTSGSWNHDGIWDSSSNFIWQGSSVRAPIFYDQNDTTYYLDAASTSLFNTLKLAGSLQNNGSVSDDDGFGIYWDSGGSTAYAIYREAGSWTHPYPDLRIAFHTGIKLGANAGYNGIRFYDDYGMANQVMSVNNSSDGLGANNVYVNNSLQAGSSLRAPIFYDSNDTTYYVDPASTSRLVALWVRGSSETAGNIYVGGTAAGDRLNINYDQIWTPNGNLHLQYSGGGNIDMNYGGGFTFSRTSLRAPIFYDYNDTAYYCDPNGNSVLNGLYVNAYYNLANNYKDIYVYGDVNTYYVVLIQGEYIYSYGRYSITRGYNWAGPDTWYVATHKGGLTLDWEYSGDTAWGGNDQNIRIIEFHETYSTMVAGFALPVNGGVIVWLRGGGVNGALYRIRTPIGANSTVTVYDGITATNHSSSTSFTAANSAVFSTRANTSNVASEINSRFPVRYAGTLYNDGNAVLDQSGTSQTKSGILSSAASLRAPIFYDTDNTGYYIDPNGASSINTITSAQYYTTGWFRNNSSGNGLYNESTGQHFYSDSANYWNVASSAGAQGIRLRTGGHNGTVRGYFYADTNNDVGFLNQDGSWRLRVVGGDYALADGSSMRAQIFYDSNDTNYYVDPAGTSYLNYSIFNGLSSADYTRQFAPSGGYFYAGGAQTGAIKIRMPANSKALYPMLSFTCHIYNYSTGTSRTFKIGGHFSNSSWYNPFAYCLSESAGNLNVRWGYEGNYLVVWIGETTSGWSYPCVFITDFQNGYSAINNSWMTGWNVSLVTAFDTVTNGPTAAGFFWNQNNDGAGSGLDADLLDGINSASFLRSDVSATNSVDLRSPIFYDSNNTAYYIDPASQSKLYNLLIETGTANTSMTIVGSNQPSIFLKTTDNARNIEIFNSYGNFGIYRSNAPSNYIIYHVDNGANSSTEMQLQGTARLTINSNGLTGATSVRSPIFYDSDNTGYYIDAASTSILNLVRTRNTFGERIAVTSAASTTIDTNFNVTELTMSASITTLTLSNIQASTIVHMWTIVTVGNGTAYSITWPAAIKWPGGTAPTITSTNAKRDIYQFVTYDGGTNIYAIIVGQNL